MALAGLGAILAVALTLVTAGAGPRRLAAAVLFVALSPIALGPASLNTYDLWPAALSAGALAALVRTRPRLALGLLGAAFAAKLYPAVLLGPALWYVWRTEGARRAREAAAAFAAIAAAFIVPFVALAADGVGHSLRLQLGRALHAESLGASVLLAGDRLGVYAARVVVHPSPPVSRDLAGELPDAVAVASSVLAVAAVLAVWALFARGRVGVERLVLAFAAATAGFLAFGKVFSPQYAEWLVPLVPLVAAIDAPALLLAALILAQTWYFHYPRLWALGWPVWPLVVRNVLVVVLYALLVTRLKTSTPSSSKTSRQDGFRRRLTRSVAAGSGAIRSR
jgi:hypothetical protein